MIPNRRLPLRSPKLFQILQRMVPAVELTCRVVSSIRPSQSSSIPLHISVAFGWTAGLLSSQSVIIGLHTRSILRMIARRSLHRHTVAICIPVKYRYRTCFINLPITVVVKTINNFKCSGGVYHTVAVIAIAVIFYVTAGGKTGRPIKSLFDYRSRRCLHRGNKSFLQYYQSSHRSCYQFHHIFP